jgi:DNA-binding NarL/FixJ family response regulator
MRRALEEDFEIDEVASRGEAIELVRDVGGYDVAIVDMRIESQADDCERVEANEAIRIMLRAEPAIGIVAHGERAQRHLASAALQAGASAYLARTASANELQRAALAALDQEPYVDPAVPPRGSRGMLTKRQREILQLLANGESTTVAARELDLSEETVKTHTKHALARLGARNRTHAVAIAMRECLID